VGNDALKVDTGAEVNVEEEYVANSEIIFYVRFTLHVELCKGESSVSALYDPTADRGSRINC
jgi:hypothetical protein